MDRFVETIRLFRSSTQPRHLSIVELIVMAHFRRLGKEPEDSYADAPSMSRCSEHAAIPHTYHISEAGCFWRHEIPAANSGQQLFLESWESLQRVARL